MTIVVILKQVPDTEAVVRPDPSRPQGILTEDVKFILNPYDEFAVEEALSIAESTGGEVVGICIGPAEAESAVLTALAMGVDRAMMITDPGAVETDIVTKGRILAEAIKPLNPSLVLCGREWIDTQEDALAAVIAEYLDLPHVGNVGKLSVESSKLTAVREMDGGSLEIESTLPAIVSCSKDLNEPRYPTLIKIKRAKTKEIKSVTLSDLNLAFEPPRSRVKILSSPPARQAGRVVKGEPDATARDAVAWLSDEAKII
ncbi:electron transfer flavoprotein subunit beta/FixA family protein [bacterium]|nr:electron transfer flavoprotein subunit beta/FixA family protein [candidate division CSSED10-310 bacterium]